MAVAGADSAAGQLCPHAGTAFAGSLQAPSLAEHLHQVQPHPAALDRVRGPGCDDAVVAGVLDFHPAPRLGEADADGQLLAGSGTTVSHAVGDQLGDEQLRMVEHGRRHPVAEIPGDDLPGSARRPDVRRKDDFQRLTHLNAAVGCRPVYC